MLSKMSTLDIGGFSSSGLNLSAENQQKLLSTLMNLNVDEGESFGIFGEVYIKLSGNIYKILNFIDNTNLFNYVLFNSNSLKLSKSILFEPLKLLQDVNGNIGLMNEDNIEKFGGFKWKSFEGFYILNDQIFGLFKDTNGNIGLINQNGEEIFGGVSWSSVGRFITISNENYLFVEKKGFHGLVGKNHLQDSKREDHVPLFGGIKWKSFSSFNILYSIDGKDILIVKDENNNYGFISKDNDKLFGGCIRPSKPTFKSVKGKLYAIIKNYLTKYNDSVDLFIDEEGNTYINKPKFSKHGIRLIPFEDRIKSI